MRDVATLLRSFPDPDSAPDPTPISEFGTTPLQAVQVGDPAVRGITDIEITQAIAACEMCQGVGYVTRAVPSTHVDFGRAVVCPQCASFIQEQNRRKLSRSIQATAALYATLLTGYTRYRFSNFDARVPGVSAAYNAVMAWTQGAVGEIVTRPWCFLYGPPGCGKTHLAGAAANYCDQLQVPVVLATLPELLGRLRSLAIADKEQFIEGLSRLPVLILDDLGVENRTAWTEESFYRILNARYLERLPTLFTANAAPADVWGTGTRETSRVLDQALCRNVPVAAADYRQRQRD